MRFFGASDAYMKYSESINKAFSEHFRMDSAPLLDIPLSLNRLAPIEQTLSFPALVNFNEQSDEKIQQPLLPERTAQDVSTHHDESFQNRLHSKSYSEDDLKVLLGILHDAGIETNNIDSLPSGVTKITFDDLIPVTQVREPELVRVRA
jgi:hypothetical protein